jgi:cation:H+ antiporter
MAWMFIAGLIGLVAGAELLVRGASKLALSWGISPLVVGLTIVAFGTSAPEVAVAVEAVLDGRTDIAIGNVVGSNTFNILGGLGISGLVAADGLSLAPAVLNFDIWVMLAVAFASLPVFISGTIGLLLTAVTGKYGQFARSGTRKKNLCDSAALDTPPA